MAAIEGSRRAPQADPLSLATDSPFSYRIQATEMPPRFRLPPLPTYDGATDPIQHINSFNAVMKVARGDTDEVKCQVFPLTLVGAASTWLSRLPPRSIDSFYELSNQFMNNYQSCISKRASASDLFQIRQRKGESLRDFCSRFNLVMNEIPELQASVAYAAFFKAVANESIIRSLEKSEPATLAELISR